MDREMRVYLAGGIHTDKETGTNHDVYRIDGREWRPEAQSQLGECGIETYDPKIKVGAFPWDVNEIVGLDIWEIERSTLVLAELMDDKYPYIGTIQELVYAKTLRKPVIVFANEYRRGHPWIRYHATKIFASFQEAVDYVQERFGLWLPARRWADPMWKEIRKEIRNA